MEIIKEYICDMTADQQKSIKAEIETALKFFGYNAKQRERMTARYMKSTLADACNLIGAYKWAREDEQISADIACGKTADAAIQDTF